MSERQPLVIRVDGGRAAAGTVLPLVVGYLVWVWVQELRSAAPRTDALIFGGLIGGVMFGITLLVWFYRTWVILDPAGGRVIQSRTFLFLSKRRETPLAGFGEIRLHRLYRVTRSGRAGFQDHVSAWVSGNDQKVFLGRRRISAGYDQFRQDCLKWAQHLGIGFIEYDEKENHVIASLTAEALNQPLQVRLRKEIPSERPALRPRDGRISFEEKDGKTRIALPRPFWSTVVLGAGILGALAAWAPVAVDAQARRVLLKAGDPQEGTTVLVGIGAVAVLSLGMLFLGLYVGTRREELLLSAEGIEIVRRWALGRSRRMLPLQELWEIQVTRPVRRSGDLLSRALPLSTLTIRTNVSTERVGRGLGRDDLGWLQGAIEDFLRTNA